MKYRLFLEGYNIFDRVNVVEVNAHTGRAWDDNDYELEGYLNNRTHPLRYGGRRHLMLGMSLAW